MCSMPLKAAISQVFADAFSSTSYTYDVRGWLVERDHRMGTLGEIGQLIDMKIAMTK
jgi:hypothetical protein